MAVKSQFFKLFFLTVLFICYILVGNFLLINCEDVGDPYKILDVPRNADDKMIRNAYRRLAKDWHPDKNKSPNANEKFMQISQAYEILSDAERRSLYDDYGTTNEPRQGNGGYYRESYNNFFRDFEGFESFFSGGDGFRFNFQNEKQRSRKSKEEEINKKIYEETIHPNSHTKPFLIYSYTEFCWSCMAVESIWLQFKQEVKNIGFGFGHSDASWNRELTRNLGISQVPSIVGIVNGRVHHFRGEFNLKNLRDFVRKLMPSKIVSEVNIYNFNETLNQIISENKVFSLFLSTSNQVTLRYQMPCFQFTNLIKCSSISLNSIDEEFKNYLNRYFGIDISSKFLNKQEIVVIFKENTALLPSSIDFFYKPAFISKVNEFSFENIIKIFESNKQLNLPRLSSLQHFFDICPSWLNSIDQNSKRIFCLVYISNSETKLPGFIFEQNLRAKFLKKLKADDFINRNSQFTYIFMDIQSDFVEKVAKNSKIKFTNSVKSNIEGKLLILKRIDDKYIHYDWMNILSYENGEEIDYIEQVKSKLKQFVIDDQLQFKLIIPQFYQESSLSLISVIIDYIQEMLNYFTDIYFWEKLIGNSSYMMILICTILFVWLMMMFSSEKSIPASASAKKNININKSKNSHSPKREQFKESPSFSTSSSSSLNDNNKSFSSDYNINTFNEFQLVEMNKKTYQSLITCLPKGFRTILLVLNQENKNLLYDLFTKISMKYSNRSYQLRFGYLNLNTLPNQKWFNELMFDKYKELEDDLNDDDNSLKSTKQKSNSTSSLSSEDDFEKIKQNYKYQSGKMNDGGCIFLAINSNKKYFTTFNFKPTKSSFLNLNIKKTNDKKSDYLLEECLNLEDETSYKQEFLNHVSNCLDKYTEGLCDQNKKFVDEWPEYN